MLTTYRVFTRSARNWREFARARKTTVARGLTLEEARQLCKMENEQLTARQRARGLKYEIESE